MTKVYHNKRFRSIHAKTSIPFRCGGGKSWPQAKQAGRSRGTRFPQCGHASRAGHTSSVSDDHHRTDRRRATRRDGASIGQPPQPRGGEGLGSGIHASRSRLHRRVLGGLTNSDWVRRRVRQGGDHQLEGSARRGPLHRSHRSHRQRSMRHDAVERSLVRHLGGQRGQDRRGHATHHVRRTQVIRR